MGHSGTQLATRWIRSLARPPQRTYFDFLPDTLGGVRQFLCGGRFDAYNRNKSGAFLLGNKEARPPGGGLSQSLANEI